MYDYIHYDSPLGTLTIAAEKDALTALVIEGQKYEELHLTGGGRERETPVLHQAKTWLDRYFAGERPNPAELKLSPKGTAFQQRVWQELLRIPYGRTVSYGSLAAHLGSSARAVGSAVGRNPISVIIPCHRVLGADGSLGGYAGGLENKMKLLRLEKYTNEERRMELTVENTFAAPVIPGVEDKFYYVISEDCVMCASCAEACPVQAITEGDDRYEIDPVRCIDCGTCSYVCPLGIPQPV